jgi:carbon storage regulator
MCTLANAGREGITAARVCDRPRPAFQEAVHHIGFPGTDQKARAKEATRMLVLNRKLGEEILIGSDICVRVVRVSRSRVRLAIAAPTPVPICRSEIPGSSAYPPASDDPEQAKPQTR